jgi:hypothetical protein
MTPPTADSLAGKVRGCRVSLSPCAARLIVDPSRPGISLTRDQWAALVKHAPAIDAAVARLG